MTHPRVYRAGIGLADRSGSFVTMAIRKTDITLVHLLRAAERFDLNDRVPEGYDLTGINKYQLEIDHPGQPGLWFAYPPLPLIAMAIEEAGYPTPDSMILKSGGTYPSWRRYLATLPGCRVTPVLREAKAEDLTDAAVRGAAAVWVAKPETYRKRFSSKDYDVWIDGAPYPPKAIGVLAADLLGLRRPTGWGYGTANGPWYKKLDALGFRVQPKQNSTVAQLPALTSVTVGTGALPPQNLTSTEICHALDVGDAVLVDDDPDDTALDAFSRQPGLSTTARREVETRLGQGKFRDGLLVAFGGRCVLTGIETRSVLRAAHIQRWADCSADPMARRDLQNGLLFSANLDCLFEVGLITFDDKGRILISDQLDIAARDRLGLHDDMHLPGPLSDRRRAYLAAHRKRVGFLIEDDDTENREVVRRAFNW